MPPKTAVSAPEPTAVSAPDKPISDWTDAEIVAVFPKVYPKPVKDYTTTELVALKNFGPAQIGGALYLASQKVSASTSDGIYGPAILDKGFTPVPFVSEMV